MDMLLELLTNPKPITKRDGRSEPFQFEKLERALTNAFKETGKTDEALIREVLEEILSVFGPIYAQTVPTTQALRESVFQVLEKRSFPDVKARFVAKPTSTPPAAPVPSPVHVQTSASTFSPPSMSDSLRFTSSVAPTSSETHMARRRRLNEERKAVTHKFQVGAYEGYLIVGLYDDGQPGEIFLRMNKEGSMLSGLMDSFATAVSIGLQYGVPLKVLVKKFAGSHFEPNGPTQNPNIPHARSIMDYIFRWLALKFLTPEERQTVLGIHVDEPGGEQSFDVSNVDGARQPRLLGADQA